MEKFSYTFIIPHHNSPELLNRCLDSIPQREDIQIIVVDDNRQEDKKPQVNRQDVQLIYIDAHHTKGAGHARNVGLEYANGKCLLFADCDDYYKQGFIDILDEYRNKEIDVLYFNFEHRDGRTNELLKDLFWKTYISQYDGSPAATDLLKFRQNVPWTKMVSRSFIRKYQIQFEEVPNGNDIFFSMLVGYFSENIEVEKREIYVYLKNENSILTSKLSNQGRLCKLTHRIKQNQFYCYVGHKEWSTPVFRSIIGFLIKSRFTLLIPLIKNLKQKKEWIYEIEKRFAKS